MRKTIKNNREVLHQMRKIYFSLGKEYIDWMGFRITEENCPSYHHIEKAETLRKKHESDVATVENGAYLGKKSHELLHKIESLDKELYIMWNQLFRIINESKKYPSDDLLIEVYTLQNLSKDLCKKNNKTLKI